ncbi:F-box protein At1g67340-like [Bidens hawaiensis]|uniref:F-box protein At1g67340-like n=1 Tax=Bidens hawaiensis TaxID=980011 RepID=UPI00404ABBEB
MRSRRGFLYASNGAPTTTSRKRGRFNFFDLLPDDILLLILMKLVVSAECPADFIAVLLVCKRFNCLGLNPFVLSKAPAETFAVKPGLLSAADWFFQRCAGAGNVEAFYIMGMIQFYCFHNHKLGASLMAKAAIQSHASALYSLSIIRFNGSGGIDAVKDLITGATLCTRAAFLGHVDALRELGHCLVDGYGVIKNVAEGELYLMQANLQELAARQSTQLPRLRRRNNQPQIFLPVGGLTFGFTPQNCHPANRFLISCYNGLTPDPMLRSCSYVGCGRVETRVHEFRRCSACSVTNYCSRGCQARDWMIGHRLHCIPLLMFPIINADADAGNI